ncbi:hypothetical protein C8J57DRAFT_1305573 [Mycena rebaudengoi]|nr:hypothetical protein C8J57DRAFT_1305573 [Mycena rebaudengoi]
MPQTAFYASVLVLFALGLSIWRLPYISVAFGRISPSSHSSLCNGHPCLDLPNGLRIIDNHLKHIAGIWDLLEALGHPEESSLSPSAYRLASDFYPLIRDDPEAQKLLEVMDNFLRKAQRLDTPVARLLNLCYHQFFMERPLKEIPGHLKKLESLQSSYKGFNIKYMESETDSLLNSTIAMLAGSMTTTCERISIKTEEALSIAAAASSSGSEVTSRLDDELARVKATLDELPWWDTWTISHWAGRSATAQRRAYLKYFKDEGQTLRTLAYLSSVIHDNLMGLENYCLWYTNPITFHLIQEEHHTNAKAASIQSITRDIESLLDRIRAAGSSEEPPWPPRRVRSPLARIS